MAKINEKLTYLTAGMTFPINQRNYNSVYACHYENSHFKCIKQEWHRYFDREREAFLLSWNLSDLWFNSCCIFAVASLTEPTKMWQDSLGGESLYRKLPRDEWIQLGKALGYSVMSNPPETPTVNNSDSLLCMERFMRTCGSYSLASEEQLSFD